MHFWIAPSIVLLSASTAFAAKHVAQLYIGKTVYVNECAVQSVCSLDAIETCGQGFEPFPMEWTQTLTGFSHSFLCIDTSSATEPVSIKAQKPKHR
jgi:hypothetical protein